MFYYFSDQASKEAVGRLFESIPLHYVTKERKSFKEENARMIQIRTAVDRVITTLYKTTAFKN